MKRCNSLRDFGISCPLGTDMPKSLDMSLNCMPVLGGFLRITISYPHVAKFLRLPSEKQKILYHRIWRDLVSAIDPLHILCQDHVFEFGKAGQIHLHGYVELTVDRKIIPIGLVSDVVKSVLMHMPKRYERFNNKFMSSVYCQYTSPPVCVSYDFADSSEYEASKIRWKKYMQKEQIKKDDTDSSMAWSRCSPCET